MPVVEQTDFIYPLLADVYYPLIEQGPYGNIKKRWILDRTIACAFNPAGRKFKEDMQVDSNMASLDNSMVGRIRTDILTLTREDQVSMTNILITNIRDYAGNEIFTESAGIRAGKSTLFEVATYNPIVGPFGTSEYFKIVVRRSENQGADI
jgi:hypothetical protein